MGKLNLKEISLKKKILFGILIFLIAFFTWIIIKMITMPTNLEIVSRYELPNSSSVENLYELKDGDFAAAIDGKVVTGKNFSELKTEPSSTASTIKMVLALAVMKKKTI